MQREALGVVLPSGATVRPAFQPIVLRVGVKVRISLHWRRLAMPEQLRAQVK